MGTRMLQRRGTAAEWAAANPVLGDGEVGVERDTGVVKIGDGVGTWSALTNVYRRFVDAVAKAGDTMTGRLVIATTPATGSHGDSQQKIQAGAGGGQARLALDPNNAYPPSQIGVDATGNLRTWNYDGTTFADFKAGALYDNNQRVYSPSNPQPATNPFAVIDALGDLLVGSGPDAVARLPKGANGTVLTIDGAGNVAWVAGADVSSKVSKAGDTMTGKLIIGPLGADVPALEMGGSSAVGSAASAAIMLDGPGVAHGGIGWHPANGFQFRSSGSTYAAGTVTAIRAGAIYDNNNRVYSASNPPPVSGAMINQTIRGTANASSGAATPVTIPSVNMAKAQVRNLGGYGTNAGTYTSSGGMWQLTGATTLTLTPGPSAASVTNAYEITEWT